MQFAASKGRGHALPRLPRTRAPSVSLCDVVREASKPWPQVVEQCFHALDTRRVRFRDVERRCPVASADAASLEMMVGICLWEVKTDNFDTFSSFLQRQVVENQLPELQRERALARACGFDFRIGVRSAAHEAALVNADPTFDGSIIIMDWC